MAEVLTVEARHAGQEIDRVFHAGQEADFVFGRGTTMFAKLPAEIYGRCETRTVVDAGERWFEFGFRMDHALTGNAASGWTDAGNYFRIEPQWSTDLVTWSMGKFIPAPVPVVTVGDGSFEYWSRALNPVDSAVKSASITCASTAVDGDTRNNPLTSVVIAGVTQALPNFPYTLPGHAAQLQTDLRAAGWTGTIVTASSDTVWSIAIPYVGYTAFSQSSYVGWPGYLVADVFGALTNLVARRDFGGNFIDAAGTPVLLKAFARLKITAGTRYDPYR